MNLDSSVLVALVIGLLLGGLLAANNNFFYSVFSVDEFFKGLTKGQEIGEDLKDKARERKSRKGK